MSTIKGGKKKRRGKNHNSDELNVFVEPEEGQYFARAIKPLGNFKVQLEVFFYEYIEKTDKNGSNKTKNNITFTKETMIGNVRGKMRRRQYVNPGNIVLVSKRDFNIKEKIVDIILLYKPYHYNKIKNHMLVPSDFLFDSVDDNNDVKFDNESEDEEEDSFNSKYMTMKKTERRRENANKQDYMANILPFDNDNDLEEVDFENESVGREVDAFGNYI